MSKLASFSVMRMKRYGGGVCYHFACWCNAAVSLHHGRCKSVLDKHEYNLMTERWAHTFRYVFYWLTVSATMLSELGKAGVQLRLE